MSRQVVTYEHRLDATAGFAQGADQTPPLPEDKYKDRLLKYIPAEVVTFYLTLTALLGTATGLPWWLGWVVFTVGIVATWCYLRYPLKVKDFAQLIIACFAFVIWVFALGGSVQGSSLVQTDLWRSTATGLHLLHCHGEDSAAASAVIILSAPTFPAR